VMLEPSLLTSPSAYDPVDESNRPKARPPALALVMSGN